ncbi:helix-turn-helix domain-containing protein [Streptomyces sp. NPDC002076]
MTLDPQQLGQSKADLAETLRTLRKRAGLSQVRLAKRCNVSQSKISKPSAPDPPARRGGRIPGGVG